MNQPHPVNVPPPQMQNQFNQQRVYVQQQNPQFHQYQQHPQQHPQQYPQQVFHQGMPMNYQQQHYMPQQQMLVRDQFGRLVYINQPHPQNQMVMQNQYHPNQQYQQNQAPPSPQMVSKT